jgi:DNA-binding response OmpR family regulator
MSRYTQRRHTGKPGLEDSVVLIEDDKGLRDDLAFLFEAEGIHFIAAGDGMTGMALIHEHQPQVVILDIYIPHYSGFEIIDAIRANANFDGMFIIAITGMAEDEEDLCAMKGRADMILTKPLDERRLLDFVHAALVREASTGLRGHRHS